jgi:hypothetical protein
MIIRHYESKDREFVRWLCCETGFLGKKIDPVFQDRELFADFLTNYYLNFEPESSFVLDDGGKVLGYLLGCRNVRLYSRVSLIEAIRLTFKLLPRIPSYSQSSREYLWWMIFNAFREVPPAPKRMPHFHINLLPEIKNVSRTRILIDAFLKYLADCGEKAVYGQIVTFGERRGAQMFERYGFRVWNRSEITKYRKFYPEPVFLCTVVKDLTQGVRLYDRVSASCAICT